MLVDSNRTIWREVGTACPVPLCSTGSFKRYEKKSEHWDKVHQLTVDCFICILCKSCFIGQMTVGVTRERVVREMFAKRVNANILIQMVYQIRVFRLFRYDRKKGGRRSWKKNKQN